MALARDLLRAHRCRFGTPAPHLSDLPVFSDCSNYVHIYCVSLSDNETNHKYLRLQDILQINYVRCGGTTPSFYFSKICKMGEISSICENFVI